jgi:cytochrome P450
VPPDGGAFSRMIKAQSPARHDGAAERVGGPQTVNTSGLPDGPPLSVADTTFQWLARPYAFLDECAARHGDTFTLRFSRFGTHVLVAHPDDVRAVFSGDPHVLHAGRGNALLEPVVGVHSLLQLDGSRHTEQRAQLQQVLRADRTQNHASLVADATRRWTAPWNDGAVVGLQGATLEISKEVILRLVLGLREPDLDRFSRLLHDLMRVVGTNATIDYSTSDPRLAARFRSARQALDTALQEQIERRRHLAAGEDMLSALLAMRRASRNGVSDEQIRDQLVTMILAGHETTASTITWAILCLHTQPLVREKLQREIDATGRSPGEELLVALPYLRAVCLETLRLRPVVPVVSRQLQASFRLRHWHLPAGVFVTPCAYLAHRRPEIFPAPESFRPERFLERRLSPYAYFPFGGGVRRCLGMSLALLELQIVVGMLVREFNFVPAAPVRPVRRAVTIVASGGGRMYVERRRTEQRHTTKPC